MKLQIDPGKYVVAVSGGVDSMALLDILVHTPGVELVVAHFEHGIRDDSKEDLLLVEAAAARYGLPFVYAHGNLGAGAGEARAREARYAFLHKTREMQGAAAVITAHHRDDMLETAFLNMVRGTGRRGLSSLRSTADVFRPLLHVPKEELRQYAAAHNLAWREDSTNADDRYLRNYLRRHVMPRMTGAQQQALYERITKTSALNEQIDAILDAFVAGDRLERQWFIMLPHGVSCEVMAAWLRRHGAAFDRKLVDGLTVFAKTARPGKRRDIDAVRRLEVNKQYIILLANYS